MTDVKGIIAREVKDEASKAIAGQLTTILVGLQQGKTIQELLPPIVGEVIDKKADARSRALRTFLQNLGIDLALSLVAVLMVAIPTLDVTSKEAWAALGVLLLKTLISAPISYLMRLKRPPQFPGSVVEVQAPQVDQQVYGRG